MSKLDYERYEMLKSPFGNSLTSHFPQRLSEQFSIESSEDTTGKYVGITLIDYAADEPNLKNLMAIKVDKKCVKNFGELSELKSQMDCQILLLPEIENERFKGFTGDFKYYRFKQADSTKVLKYSLSPNPTRLSGYQHGLSKGLAYNHAEHIAVYWGIVW